MQKVYYNARCIFCLNLNATFLRLMYKYMCMLCQTLLSINYSSVFLCLSVIFAGHLILSFPLKLTDDWWQARLKEENEDHDKHRAGGIDGKQEDQKECSDNEPVEDEPDADDPNFIVSSFWVHFCQLGLH